MYGVAGLISAYGQSQAQKAAGIQQQTGFLLQARDSLAIAGVRSEMDTLYTAVQAGRTLRKAEIEAQNYTIAGNTLLKNMRSSNASIRARMAASGVATGAGGSFEGVQRENVAATMRDVGIADLNALTARVMGFEDAAAMFQSTEMQNTLNMFAAKRQAGQYTQAGTAAREQSGLLAGFTLAEGGIRAGQTILKG
jgi:thioredoxin-like negative regulator of GroEL